MQSQHFLLLEIKREVFSEQSQCTCKTIANGWVGRVLARGNHAQERTFATVSLFAKGPMFVPFLVFLNLFKKKRGRRTLYNNQDNSRQIIIEQMVTS